MTTETNDQMDTQDQQNQLSEGLWGMLLRGRAVPIDIGVRPAFRLLSGAIGVFIFLGLVIAILATIVWQLNPLIVDGQPLGRIFLIIGVAVFIPLSILCLIKWARRCVQTVGGTPPNMAVLTRFGRPVDAVPPGGYIILYPLDKLVPFPMGQYTLEYDADDVSSKDEIIQWPVINDQGDIVERPRRIPTTTMRLEYTFNFRWPHPDEDYDVVDPEAKVEEGENEALKKVSGRDLLMQAYRFLPLDPSTATWQDVWRVFQGPTRGAIRHAAGQRNHIAFREEKEDSELVMITYLRDEPGNPVHDMGIPRECINIDVTRVKVPDDVDKALLQEQLEYERGRGRIAQARADAETTRLQTSVELETAQQRAEAIKKVAVVLRDVGVPPELIPVAMQGARGEALDYAQLRDIMLIRASMSQLRPGLTELFPYLSEEDLDKLTEAVEQRQTERTEGG